MFQLKRNQKITFGVKSLKIYSTIIETYSFVVPYIPPEKSNYFDQEIFDKLENDIINFLAQPYLCNQKTKEK